MKPPLPDKKNLTNKAFKNHEERMGEEIAAVEKIVAEYENV